jgi:hypothetical protein
MEDLGSRAQNMVNVGVGLCATCKHVRVVTSDRESYFVMCSLAKKDYKYKKYPRLPVLRCSGHTISHKQDD